MTEEIPFSEKNAIPIDRPWSEYPIGTKAHDVNGGYWTKTELGWKWHGGDTFPKPGGSAVSVTLPSRKERQ